jgi:4-nitrophenyl phosphatase
LAFKQVKRMDWLANIRGLILDMDGVLWRGDEALLDMPAFFAQAEALGLKVTLATNNATRSVPQYLEKLSRYGAALHPDQVVNSPMAAAYYLSRKHPNGGNVFVVGESGLHDTLAEKGFLHAEENVLAVVAGLDRHITYTKLSKAASLIRSGVEFVGTNPDKTFPSPSGLTPGAGSVLAFIEAASDVSPVIAGKPEPFMFDLAIARMRLEPSETLAVGDRLDTDILGGQKAGCRTAAVLSGVSSLEEINAWSPPPDLVLEDLSGLLPRIQQARTGK